MKKLYIFILAFGFSYLGFSQNANIQIELVNGSVGQPSTDGFGVTTSNDDGLNAILNPYNITAYQILFSEIYSDLFYDDLSNSRYIDIVCQNCDIAQLILDLTAYSDVIKYASLDNDNELILNNALTFNLVDDTIGIPTGVNAMDIIETNDDGLNQIFSDFNVRGYEPVDYPNNSYNGNKSISCNCDAALLKLELEAYSTVISEVYEVYGGMLLSLEEIKKTNVNIYPNPFKDKVSVEISQPIERITLYDILGKRVYKSSSSVDFENFSTSLKSGIYLLKLVSSEGEIITKKLIKT